MVLGGWYASFGTVVSITAPCHYVLNGELVRFSTVCRIECCWLVQSYPLDTPKLLCNSSTMTRSHISFTNRVQTCQTSFIHWWSHTLTLSSSNLLDLHFSHLIPGSTHKWLVHGCTFASLTWVLCTLPHVCCSVAAIEWRNSEGNASDHEQQVHPSKRKNINWNSYFHQ